MPYPNEHSARLQEPSRFNPDTFRRKNDGTIYGKIKVPNTVAVIWGKLKKADKPADKPIPQALRFPTSSWTAEKAKKWLKDNNVKYIRFEPASGKKDDSSSSITVNVQSTLAAMQSQKWAMEANALQHLFNSVANQQSFLPDSVEIESKSAKLQIKNKTAIIPIKGVLMRQIPKAFIFWGIEGTSYQTIADQIAEAIADEQVSNILLDVDSPGGAVPGVLETADIIRQARKDKPIHAMVDDFCASSAYWLASQANSITSVPNGESGSIGVFCVYADSSKRAEDLGIKVHLIRSGEHKGMGVPGVEITESQIEAVQEIVNGIADNFIASVAVGRGVKKSTVSKWADGRLWLAEEAVKMDLIDNVTNSVTTTVQRKEKQNRLKGSIMETDQQIDAQIAENEKKAIEQEKEKAVNEERQRAAKLKDAFDDDPEFAVKAIAEGWTVEKAKSEYCDVLKERLKEQSKTIEQKTAKKESIGAEAIATEGNDDQIGDDFLTVAKRLAEEKKITMTAAMRHLARTKPDLHRAFKERCKTEGHQIYAEAI